MDLYRPIDGRLARALKWLAAGLLAPILLAIVAIVTANVSWLSWLSNAAIFLLAPGIFLGFDTTSGHVHDFSFWGWTLTLDMLIYALLTAALDFAVTAIRRDGLPSRGTKP